MPDSNTSQRVTIGALGHVVVSKMGIVQVPYATVTLNCFWRPYMHDDMSGVCMWGMLRTRVA